jgi:short-subunit dehydrogenase
MDNNSNQKIVLITGASSGIGAATAMLLAQKGFKVYGTSRKITSDRPENQKFQMLQLDVNNPIAISEVVNQIIENEGRIDVLINNAGYGLAGAIEDTELTEMKQQFDTNFFGLVAVCKAVLPHMRAQRAGTIINISSVAGFISLPFQSMYSASKFAVEAFSEALRIEVKPFGVKICLVEPGDTKTAFSQNRPFAESSKNPSSVYYNRLHRSIQAMEKDEQNGYAAGHVASVILRCIAHSNPPLRTVVGLNYKLIAMLKRLMPDVILEKIITKMYG